MRGKTKMHAMKSVKDMRLSEWLKAELEAHNMTQTDLSRATGLKYNVINHLLKHGGTPRRKTVNSIADGLLLPRDELYRVAGILQPLSHADAQWERMKYKYLLLSLENRAKFDRLLDFELKEQRRGKASKK
jgi:transcriptional regulator with XRE-family HTH domain